jgi:hypothetical protein
MDHPYTGGDQRGVSNYLTLLELRSPDDFAAVEACYQQGELVRTALRRLNLELGVELDMTRDAWRFVQVEKAFKGEGDVRQPPIAYDMQAKGYLLVYEGKSIWHYDDCWAKVVKSVIPVTSLTDRSYLIERSRYFRLAYRAIQNAENERTLTCVIVPPGKLFGNSAPCERRPWEASNSARLTLQAIFSAFPSDWLLRLKITANVNQFIFEQLPIAQVTGTSLFLAHSSLRLTCNHSGYEPLWHEQLGSAWRENGNPKFSWPVLVAESDRWLVRSAIDAVVALSFGLSRTQYAHVLSTFKHTSYTKAPELCLAMFDELMAIGLDAFTKKHDPYWDIPLNENLQQPVIDLPVAEAEQSTVGDPALGPQFRLSDQPARQRAKRKR